MIQANELKKGNFVLDRGGKMLRVDWIEKYKVCMDLSNDSQFPLHPLTEDFEYLQPIPLTEDILLKAGFEKNKDLYRLSKYWVEFRKFDSVGEKILFGCFQFNQIYIMQNNTLQHLHQLQNLYFALTNQELEIKL